MYRLSLSSLHIDEADSEHVGAQEATLNNTLRFPRQKSPTREPENDAEQALSHSRHPTAPAQQPGTIQNIPTQMEQSGSSMGRSNSPLLEGNNLNMARELQNIVRMEIRKLMEVARWMEGLFTFSTYFHNAHDTMYRY